MWTRNKLKPLWQKMLSPSRRKSWMSLGGETNEVSGLANLQIMDLRYLLRFLWENFSSTCMGSACTTQLFLFEDSVHSVFLFPFANLPVSQDHGSFEFVNQTVEKELYFDAWPIHRKPAKARVTGGFW